MPQTPLLTTTRLFVFITYYLLFLRSEDESGFGQVTGISHRTEIYSLRLRGSSYVYMNLIIIVALQPSDPVAHPVGGMDASEKMTLIFAGSRRLTYCEGFP